MYAAIRRVVDPCSRFNGTDLSLVDLGMVEWVKIKDGVVNIRLLLDDPTCIYTFVIQRDIREAVSQLAKVDAVEIELTPDQIWTEDRMLPDARERLLQHREWRRAQLFQFAQLSQLRTIRSSRS